MTDSTRTPRMVSPEPGKTLRDYPLDPVDGFVLSRIDGRTTEAEMLSASGMNLELFSRSLDKLLRLGLVSCDPVGTAERARASQPASPRPASAAPTAKPISDQPAPRRRSSMSDLRRDDSNAPLALYDPAELDEEVDLDKGRRRAILDVFHRIDSLDYYALLGVARTAEKKAIKRAYFELATTYHPDKYFGKRLGSFKSKMETVFGRMTLAHDSLTRRESREQYDQFLGDLATTERHEAAIAHATGQPDDGVLRIALPESTTTPSTVPARQMRVSDEARRAAFARRLTGARHANAPPPPAAPIVAASDPDALRRHYENRVSGARDRIISGHLSTAESALERDDPAAATAACRQALDLAPERHELRPALQAAMAAATESLGESYRRQGAFHERSGLWKDSEKSWKNAVKCLPNHAETHHRAASAVLKANGNLHEAAQMATRATVLEPAIVAFRVTLAQVYVAAGLTLNAKRELDAALLIAPDDASLHQLRKHIGQ